jgi:hypothetical protein
MKWRRFFYAFLLRMIFAYVCVFALYNTTGISLWHWPTESRFAFWMKITVGLALLASYFIMAWSTYGALKLKGILFSSIIIASIWITLVEFLAMLGQSRPELGLIFLSSIATLFGIGINYSPIHYRLAGIGHTEVIQ